MKTKLAAIVLIACAQTVVAEVTETQRTEIQAMIQEVKTAPEGERYQKMNAFKEQLRTMNSETREEAIAQMQTLKTQEQTQTRTNEGSGEGDQVQTRSQTRMQTELESAQQLQIQNQMGKQNRINADSKGVDMGSGSGRGKH